MKELDYARGSILLRIIQTAGPVLAAQICNLLYSVVDRIFLGRIGGDPVAALGGIGLCFSVIMLIAAFANLFGMGGAPLCAMARGAGDIPRAGRILDIVFTMLLISGILLMIPGWIFAPELLRLIGAADGNIASGVLYLRIYLCGTLFFMISTGLTPFMAALGFPRMTMFSVVLGAVVNIVLDYLFIIVFPWGVAGAAAATVLAQAASASVVLGFLRSRSRNCRVKLLKWEVLRNDWRTLLNIVSLGSVAFVMTFSNSLVSFVSNNVLSRLGGEIYVAIMTIAVAIRQMLEVPALAICEGTAPLLSYNYGAGAGLRVWKAIRIMMTITLIYTASVWALIEWKAESFIRIFSSDEKMIELAVPLLQSYLFAFVFQALQYTSQATFKALNKKKRAIFFSLFRKVVIVVPLTMILPYCGNLGIRGAFYAEPVSNFLGGTLVFITMLLTLVPELKKMRSKVL